MGKAPRAAAALAALAAAFAIGACGSSNDNGSTNGGADASQITQAITAAATSDDPSVCTKYQTQRFLDQTNDAQGAAAVRECQKNPQNSVADKVVVSDIQVEGDTATAKAAVTGSIFDGQTLDLALVKENGQWKLDEFKGFENLNKDALVAAARQQFSSQNTPAPAVDCIAQQIQTASEADIEGAFSGDSKAENRLFGPCSKYFKGG